MSLTTVRNLIVSKLYAKTAKPVIQMEQTATKPAYPFIGYKIIVSDNREPGMSVMERVMVDSTDPLFDYDIKETAIDQVTATFSFNAYGAKPTDAYDLAITAKNFIEHNMYYDLKDIGAVVVSVEAVGDRTVLIETSYEFRYGFDVIIRMVNSVDRIIANIENSEFIEIPED
jgi:hypothetical protein